LGRSQTGLSAFYASRFTPFPEVDRASITPFSGVPCGDGIECCRTSRNCPFLKNVGANSGLQDRARSIFSILNGETFSDAEMKEIRKDMDAMKGFESVMFPGSARGYEFWWKRQRPNAMTLFLLL
jgi:hypothetical protein